MKEGIQKITLDDAVVKGEACSETDRHREYWQTLEYNIGIIP
jgi:hypothetical protein